MKQYTKLLIVSIFSVSLLLPKKIAWACGPWPAPPEAYRLSMFQPSIGDEHNEFAAYYFSMNRYFKSEGITDFATQIEIDQNYTEWQKVLKRGFSKKDFYKAIETYSYQLITDSANHLSQTNSFIKVLTAKENKAYFEYFKLAKSSEMFNINGVSQDPWGLETKPAQSPVQLVQKLTNLLNIGNDKFIQQRTAYVLCRLFFYGHNANALNNVYNKYFKAKTADTWVQASAEYYYTRINTNDAPSDTYYQGLINVIDKSKDKRMVSIQLLMRDSLTKILPHLTDNHQKAIALAAFAVRYPAYSLNKIKQIYSLDPDNKFIPLLITREINKLEDWLLTPVLTDYETSASKDNWSWEDTAYFKNQNIKSDMAYANSFKDFLIAFSKTNSEKAALTMDLCHLNFLLKDNDAAKLCCQKVMTGTEINSRLYLQAEINTILLSLQEKQNLDDELKNKIYRLLTQLDKAAVNEDSNTITELGVTNYYESLKKSLLVYLGRSVLKMTDVADAALLLSGTYKPWGEYRTGDYKSAYFILYEYGQEKDFNQLLSILRNVHQSNFEKYFCKNSALFFGNYSMEEYTYYSTAERKKPTPYWDINKVLDLKGTYFVKKDSLDKALEAFKQIPGKFWTDSANLYNNYLTGDPFKLNIYDTHEINVDSSFKNDPNKAHFIEKLLAYKQKEAVEKNVETKAKLNYIIGNAYYSMSYFGKFWLMSKLWWGRYEREDNPTKNKKGFDDYYYETLRAKYYYQKAFSLTKDPQRAAFYCIYLTECENNRRWHQKYLAGDQNNDYQKNNFIYASLLRQKPNSDLFYKRLIKECPLYKDFRTNL